VGAEQHRTGWIDLPQHRGEVILVPQHILVRVEIPALRPLLSDRDDGLHALGDELLIAAAVCD